MIEANYRLPILLETDQVLIGAMVFSDLARGRLELPDDEDPNETLSRADELGRSLGSQFLIGKSPVEIPGNDVDLLTAGLSQRVELTLPHPNPRIDRYRLVSIALLESLVEQA